jgi:CubicO group peptidase (beta-lactamase class C family)
MLRTFSVWTILAAAGTAFPIPAIRAAGDNKDDAVEDLVRAASRGEVDAIQAALDRGADVNGESKYGLTALHAAKAFGREDAVEVLLKRGAKPDAKLTPPEEVVHNILEVHHNLEVHDGERSPATAVIVAQDGKVLFVRAAGLADVGHRVVATPDTKFRIGSVTKQFTAAAILKLQEEGKLSVTDTLAKFLPDYPRGAEVTLHHLLTHTSGIVSYTSKPDFFEHVRLAVKPEDLIRSFKDDPYDFNPGQKMLYNNSGYFLLGHIVEKVSGMTYGDFLRRSFFEPLGMTASGVHNSTEVFDDEAEGYSFVDGKLQKAENWDMSRAGGAGALYSTVEDLMRWAEGLFGGKVLKDESLKAALTPVVTAEDEPGKPKDGGYGYGLAVETLRGLRVVSHAGGLHGFSSFLLHVPSEKFTVAVLSNAVPPPPGPGPGDLARELILPLFLWQKMKPRERPAVAAMPSAAALDSYAGRYDYGAAVMTVTREGDRLFAQLTGQEKFEIFPKSETEFFWKVVDAEVSFVKNDKGEVTKAVHRQGGQTIHAAKLQEVELAKVDPALYDAYAGKYDYGKLLGTLTVTREGEKLFAQLTGQPRFEIVPRSETEFFWKVINAKVTFVRGEDGKVTKAVHEQGGRKIEAPRIE